MFNGLYEYDGGKNQILSLDVRSFFFNANI